MATVINNPPSQESSGMSVLFIGLVLLLLAFLFFYYGLPALRQASSGPEVNIPSQIDVNVNPNNTGQ